MCRTTRGEHGMLYHEGGIDGLGVNTVRVMLTYKSSINRRIGTIGEGACVYRDRNHIIQSSPLEILVTIT